MTKILGGLSQLHERLHQQMKRFHSTIVAILGDSSSGSARLVCFDFPQIYVI
jgi:hypothetical protein